MLNQLVDSEKDSKGARTSRKPASPSTWCRDLCATPSMKWRIGEAPPPATRSNLVRHAEGLTQPACGRAGAGRPRTDVLGEVDGEDDRDDDGFTPVAPPSHSAHAATADRRARCESAARLLKAELQSSHGFGDGFAHVA
jgi:hypothetical protein